MQTPKAPSTLLRLALAFSCFGASSHAALVNLTGTTTSFAASAGPNVNVAASTYLGIDNASHAGAVISGALFRPGGQGSGTGSYRSLFKIDGGNGTPTEAYNRDVGGTVFDEKSVGADLRLSELRSFGGYYAIALDIKESNSTPAKFLSVDEIQIYVGGSSDPSTLPTTVAGLNTLGTKVWDMQNSLLGGTRNTILLDSSASSGGGTDDLLILVPTALFNGFASNSMVYLYAKSGNLGVNGNPNGVALNGFINDGSDEEWAVATTGTSFTPVFTPPSAVPEPSVPVLAGLAMALGLRRRRA